MRPGFNKALLFISFLVTGAISFKAACQAAPEKKLGWKLGAQAYTFNRFTFSEALDKTKNCGLTYIEAYPGQVIGGGIGGKMDYHMPEETRAQVRKMIKDKGIEMVSFGVTVADNEADWKQLFEFAKAMGIKNLTAEPDPRFLPYLSTLCETYKINLAIHNHPQPTRYWNPDTVLAAIKGLGSRVGVCADIGHWVRSGLDPVACLKKLEGHILQLHVKDMNEKSLKAHDVHWGTGVSQIAGVLRELRRQGFKGLFSAEYEHNWENNVPDVKASVQYFRHVAQEIKNTN